MGEVYRVVDLNDDGVCEILAGGTTVSAAFAQLFAVVEDRLVRLPFGTFDGLDGDSVGSSGCGDLDGNGLVGPIQVTGLISDGEVRWQR